MIYLFFKYVSLPVTINCNPKVNVEWQGKQQNKSKDVVFEEDKQQEADDRKGWNDDGIEK